MFGFIVSLPIWKALSETWVQHFSKSSGLRHDWKQRKIKTKTFLCAKPGHAKVLALQKPVRVLNKKIQNINSR